MKSFIVSAWVVLIYVGNTIGDLFAGLSGLTDWSQLGWAFGGSTAFVLWEFIENKQRDGWRRIAMIALGMFIAMAASKQATQFLGWDPALVTAALGPHLINSLAYSRRRSTRWRT
jgi:hypothetical protein